MQKDYDRHFKTEVCRIEQGEFYVSNAKEIVTTTVGSCITTCIFDLNEEIGGMNHFLLPKAAIENETVNIAKAKYGIHAMEVLINEILKNGGRKERLKAKIFGGARMSKPLNNSFLMSVGEQNIKFAKFYLEIEGITLINEDVGKDYARKIYMDTKNGDVKLFKLNNSMFNAIADDEKKFKETVIENEKKEKLIDKITLF